MLHKAYYMLFITYKSKFISGIWYAIYIVYLAYLAKYTISYGPYYVYGQYIRVEKRTMFDRKQPMIDLKQPMFSQEAADVLGKKRPMSSA